MTNELKPCLAYPCGGVLETNLYDASLTCSRCQFQVADELEYNALVAGRRAAIDDEKQNPWKAAIINELIVDNILTEELERDPRKALAAAIDWNCKVALDPSVSKEAQDLQQRAIDAALSDLIHDLGGLYIHRNGHELYNSAIDDVARFIKDQLGTNPLAERAAEYARGIEFRVGQLAEAQARIDALEKQRASLFKEGAEAAAIAAERIAELEGKLRSADGLAKFNSNLFTEQARRIAELERELAEARKDAERWKHARNDPRVAAIYCGSAMAPGHLVDEGIDRGSAEQEKEMAITITGENVLLEGDKYDALCGRATQATRYEKVVALVGEVLNYTGWEDDADDDAKDAFQRLRAAFEAL